MATRENRPQGTCDAPGCDVPVRRGIRMCRPHWYRLPPLLRESINQTWASRQIRAGSANCLEARRFLRDNPPSAIADRITGDMS